MPTTAAVVLCPTCAHECARWQDYIDSSIGRPGRTAEQWRQAARTGRDQFPAMAIATITENCRALHVR